MSKFRFEFWFPLCIFFAYSSQVAQAGLILAVDFGPGPVQSGFSQFDVDYAGPGFSTPGPITNTYGSITATIDATTHGMDDQLLLDRDRGEIPHIGSFSYSDLFRDLVAARVMSVQLDGLAPLATYHARVWSYDLVTPLNSSNWTANGDLVQESYVYNDFHEITSNDEYSFAFNVVADSFGRISIVGMASDATDEVRLNGLQLSSVEVPEPQSLTRLASLALLGLGGVGAAISRRRRNRCMPPVQ